jgi:hypothetical protein
MADSPSRPGRDPSLGPEPVIIRAPLVPPRRQSLGEEEAFPITAADIQAPRLPPVAEQQVTPSAAAAPTLKRRFNVTAIVFVVVAAVGALAAVRFYVAASHDTAPAQE